jgi:hypothetical protein
MPRPDGLSRGGRGLPQGARSRFCSKRCRGGGPSRSFAARRS